MMKNLLLDLQKLKQNNLDYSEREQLKVQMQRLATRFFLVAALFAGILPVQSLGKMAFLVLLLVLYLTFVNR